MRSTKISIDLKACDSVGRLHTFRRNNIRGVFCFFSEHCIGAEVTMPSGSKDLPDSHPRIFRSWIFPSILEFFLLDFFRDQVYRNS